MVSDNTPSQNPASGHGQMLPIDLSIIIVNWNVADLLAKCLESLQNAELQLVDSRTQTLITYPQADSPVTEVIVVDSASQDNSLTILSQHFPWVRVLACQENIGFVRGNNLGLQHAQGRYLMLLNPDTEVQPATLRQLWQVLENNPTVGMAGPQTLNTDGSHQSTRRRFPSLWLAIFESTWLESLAPRRLLNHFRVLDMPDNAIYPVDWVQGSALMARRTVYEQIGGLDERYIMYSEELDWCKRAHLASWQIWYIGEAVITHHGGQSSEQVKVRSHIHFQHSKLRYFRKFHGRAAAWSLRAIILLNYLWQMGIEGLKWGVGHKRPLRRERLKTYHLVIRSLLWAGEEIASSQR